MIHIILVNSGFLSLIRHTYVYFFVDFLCGLGYGIDKYNYL